MSNERSFHFRHRNPVMDLIKLNVLSLLVITMLNQWAYAQTLEEVQALNLGRVAVTDNDSVGTISVNRDSFVSATNGVRILVPGTPAIFEARGFDANRRLYITVQALQSGTVTVDFSPEQFTVQSYDADEFVVTDDNGDVDIVVGAIFATSGNGSRNFRDTDFTANYSITVNY